MNIFATSPNPIECAIALDDKRVIKMVLESAQMLSTAIHMHHGSYRHKVYRPTHQKHPCTQWVSQSRGNWEWLYAHMVALSDEYTYRFGKIHKTSEMFQLLYDGLSECLPEGEFSPPPNCAAASAKGIDFKHISDVYEAYRQYLNARWKNDTRPPVWNKRNPPLWSCVKAV